MTTVDTGSRPHTHLKCVNIARHLPKNRRVCHGSVCYISPVFTHLTHHPQPLVKVKINYNMPGQLDINWITLVCTRLRVNMFFIGNLSWFWSILFRSIGLLVSTDLTTKLFGLWLWAYMLKVIAETLNSVYSGYFGFCHQ